MLFRILFYVGQVSGVALFATIAVIAANAVFGFNQPLIEGVLAIALGLAIGGGIFSALSAIYLAIRKWQVACPICNTTGDLIFKKPDLYVACASCGDVGGRSFWDWSIKVYPPGNPTRDWNRDASLALEVDLDRGTLCGVRVGDGIRGLQRLGPVEYAPSLRLGEYMYYVYFSRGLEYGAVNGVLRSFSVYGNPPDDPRHSPFAGIIRCHGNAISLMGMNPRQAIDRFGQPFDREECDGQVCLYFEHSGIVFDLEFSADEKFSMLTVNARASSASTGK